MCEDYFCVFVYKYNTNEMMNYEFKWNKYEDLVDLA